MFIGYARVSTGLQNLNLQLDALEQYGCEKTFHDKISGAQSKRPGLDQVLQYARKRDTIVVWRLDRMGRNMQDLIQERSAAGRAAARARGRLGGRPEKFNQKDIEMMKALVQNKTPIKDVAEKWGVSRTTIYRYLAKG